MNETKSGKEFYRWIILLIIPIAVQNLINVGVTSTDTIMMGFVSPISLSAVSLASNIYFLLTLFYSGLSSGAMVLMSQYWGKKDFYALKQVAALALMFSFLIGLIFATTAFTIPHQIMNVFTNDAEVANQGAEYLKIVGFAYILSSFSTTYLNIIRSVERVTVAAVTYGISFLINVCVNGVLIFGMFGITPMGIKGAAVGTVVARTFEVTVTIFYSKFKVKEIDIKLKDFFIINKVLLKDFLSYSLTVTANETLWGIGVAMISVIIGHMGVDVIGANSVATVAKQFAMVISLGIANATAIVIGKSIGERHYHLVWEYAKKMLIITIVFGVIGSILILVLKPILINHFIISNQSKIYLSDMIYILSYTNIIASINSTLIVGLFRGGGDTAFGLFVDIVGLWFFAIPMGAAMAFIFKLSPVIVYAFLVSDEIVKLPFTLKRFMSKKWIKNVTR